MITKKMTMIKLSPTLAMSNRVRALKANGVQVFDFTIGEPDFNTPDFIKNAGIDAINKNHTRYTSVLGTQELRQAIVGKLKRDNNLDYTDNEIIVTNGAKQALFNVMFTTLEQGDEVIIPTPSWVSYFDIVQLCNGVCVKINTSEDTSFKITAKQLEKAITSKTKWLMLNSPSNPAGAVYTKNELEALIAVLRKYPHVYVVSDDIYEYLCYDEAFYTMAQLAPDLLNRVVIVNGVSKAFAMTGWRIGYCVSKNTELIQAINVIQSQSTSSVNAMAQHAAAIALMDTKREFLPTWLVEYKKRRDLCVAILNKAKYITCFTPAGAFYVFCNVSASFGKREKNDNVIANSADFAKYLLENYAVGTVSGSAFEFEGYIRISFATDIQTLQNGLDRIVAFCNELR